MNIASMNRVAKSVTERRIIEKTMALEVGGIYFLSSFNDKDGATVKVLSKSTKINTAGWPSSVEVEVIECISERQDNFHLRYYAPGTRHTVNGTNLYKNRSDASWEAKRSK